MTHATGAQLRAAAPPIVTAELEAIRRVRVKTMDETPIKAGRKGQGKLKTGYFWQIWGDTDGGGGGDIVFLYRPSRAAAHVREGLGDNPGKVRFQEIRLVRLQNTVQVQRLGMSRHRQEPMPPTEGGVLWMPQMCQCGAREDVEGLVADGTAIPR